MEFDVPLSPSTRAMIEAATNRGIPALRLGTGNLVQLGYGVRQRRIRGAETHGSSAVGESIAYDKELTRSLLREAGIPLPPESVAAESRPQNTYRMLIVGNRLMAAVRCDSTTAGSEFTDVTEQVHPEIAARAIEAAQVVGLEVAGVEIVAADLAQPLEAQGGAVLELHARPDLGPHLNPTHGSPRPVAEAIVALMFPAGGTGRIPIVAVTGGGCHVTASCLVAHVLQAQGSAVALSRDDGWFFAGRHVKSQSRDLPDQQRMLLINPLVESAIFETGPAAIARDGLVFDRCDVAIATDAIIADGPHSHDELLGATGRLLQAVGPSGVAVVNAHDPLLVALAEQCPSEVIYFARGDRPGVPLTRGRGPARILFVREGCVFAAANGQQTKVARFDDFSFAYGGLIAAQIESLLAAIAGCWALGISWQSLRACLASLAAELDPFSDLAGAWCGPVLPESAAEPHGLVAAR
ncbi:MAG TPA: hypothetical protein VF306_20060 [Pirellulales bacterium]